MHLYLFEDATVRHLEPLVLTRHMADLRYGMHTLAEMQKAAFGVEGVGFVGRKLVEAVTRQEHPGARVNQVPNENVLLVNARLVPREGAALERLKAASASGEPARVFTQNDDVVAAWLPSPPAGLTSSDFLPEFVLDGLPHESVDGAQLVSRLWDLVDDVEGRLVADFARLGRRGNEGAIVHDGAHIAGSDFLIERGATLLPGAVINSLDGPVVIAEGAVVEENAVVRGPCYIGPRAQVKAAARVDGSAIGPVCKVGGEVHGSILHSLSGKPHDGYLGNSYLGQWCNLGADTNTSNLKNDYGEVTMFDAVAEDHLPSGRQFLGLVMGDHSKCSINFMFNTGTVVGVFANLFGGDFPPRFIPSFTWGGAAGLTEYRLEKAYRVAEAVMARRDIPLTDADRQLLAAVFAMTAAQRKAAAS